MSDSADSDGILLFGSLVLCLWGGARWYVPLFTVASLGSSVRQRAGLLLAPLICLWPIGIVFALFCSESDPQRPEISDYFITLSPGLLAGATLVFPFLGISPRDDVIEHRNPAALPAVYGALAGATFCAVGGNVGSGPGAWAILFSAGLGFVAFFGLWLCLELLARRSPAEAITVERDTAAGRRLGGLLVALGIILGWSVAGNWKSIGNTVSDFLVFGWPAALLTAVAVLVESSEQPKTPSPSHRGKPGAIGAAYVFAAIIYILVRVARG